MHHDNVLQQLGLTYQQVTCRVGLLRYWLLVHVAYCILR